MYFYCTLCTVCYLQYVRIDTIKYQSPSPLSRSFFQKIKMGKSTNSALAARFTCSSEIYIAAGQQKNQPKGPTNERPGGKTSWRRKVWLIFSKRGLWFQVKEISAK